MRARGGFRPGLFGAIAVLASSMALCATVGAAETSGTMRTGELTSQPIGHYEFCKVYAGECSVRSREAPPMRLTRKTWNAILNINARINAAIRPMSDLDIYGRDEVWTYPDGVGDCEDYVLLKRHLLMEDGIPASALLITVVRKPDGEGHAVLTVRTDRGDLVLDNLTSTVKLWSDTGYNFLKRQSTTHSGRWVSIESEAPVVVGSVR
mgnify:CR=1 FL=1